MNARGKQLSEFEHFKAWLQNFVSNGQIFKPNEEESSMYEGDFVADKDWKRKLDTTWLDLFWKNKASGIYNIDDVIYNACKQISLFAYIAEHGKSVDEDLTKVIRENTYIPFSYYEKHNFFNAQTLNFLFNSLNFLSDKASISIYEEWLFDITTETFFGSKLRLSSFFLKNQKNISIPEFIFYYSFLLYLNYSREKQSEISFKTWMRFSRNIIFNTPIEGPGDLINAIISLSNLKPHIDYISSYICSEDTKVSFFGNSVKQERIKFILIYVDAQWREALTRFENHCYFKGDIGFLLEMSKDANGYNFLKFKSYAEKACICFNDPIRNHSLKPLERALLTYGDYLPSVGYNHLIPLANSESFRARRDNWQRVFNNEKHRNIIKSFLDDLIAGNNEIEAQLFKRIKEYGTNDWKYFFIKSYEIIKYCTDGDGFIRFYDDENILLLKTSRIYGVHAELRSYFAYVNDGLAKLEPLTPFKKLEYWSNRMSQYSFPCIRLNGWIYHSQHYKIEITFKAIGKYLIQLLNEEKLIISENIKAILTADNWKVNTDNTVCYYEFENDSDLKPRLIGTLEKLATIQ